ncbi:MAG: hypothetical protein NTX66_00430 [Candidatus Falkowbacteria bacterium]|nr:hypothetical protein [Candidatus Falkowbacteria bacterium]
MVVLNHSTPQEINKKPALAGFLFSFLKRSQEFEVYAPEGTTKERAAASE